MTDKIKRWAAAHPYWLLTFVTFVALLPFLARPFNIDDPLFIWMARQIREHALNPYGFNAEWGWTMLPMCLATFNTRVGDGFYASAYAPLPFAFGSVPPDEVVVYALKFPPAKPPIGNP